MSDIKHHFEDIHAECFKDISSLSRELLQNEESSKRDFETIRMLKEVLLAADELVRAVKLVWNSTHPFEGVNVDFPDPDFVLEMGNALAAYEKARNGK